MNLDAHIVAVSDLITGDTEQMLWLMQAHYEGVEEQQFAIDLKAKQWVILLHDGICLRGFSTQVLFDHVVEGRVVKVLFSGDTVIEKSYWGSMALPVAWGRLMLSLLALHPDTDLYWLLTSKGYKTYRFLPVFFREFHPCYNQEPTMFEMKLLHSVATSRFGIRYVETSGILQAQADSQRLREGIANIDERRLRDPHIRFFQQRNPGYVKGDELVCIARCHPDNLTPYILRQF